MASKPLALLRKAHKLFCFHKYAGTGDLKDLTYDGGDLRSTVEILKCSRCGKEKEGPENRLDGF